MKYRHFYLLFFILLASCRNDSNTQEKESNPPSTEFVTFCSDFIAKDWDSDTSRVVSYPEISYKSIQWVNEEPFYPISLEDSRIKHFFTSSGRTDGLEVFDHVKTIWGYFYYKDNGNGWFPDGLMEEWQFDDEQESHKALETFRSIGTEVFFNTQPYACVVNNKLYLFHTRAMAFSYDQRPIFEEFVKRTKASI